jgi:hypothetical protein
MSSPMKAIISGLILLFSISLIIFDIQLSKFLFLIEYLRPSITIKFILLFIFGMYEKAKK